MDDVTALFLRPIAHRGLHNAPQGVIENTLGAARAAIVANYAIECDAQVTQDGAVVVFHDDALDRSLAAIDDLDAEDTVHRALARQA